MGLSQKLELRQSQSLIMTPQLMQAIKLLQLSSLDLAAYVDAELERNPLLERIDIDETGPAPADPDGPSASDLTSRDLSDSGGDGAEIGSRGDEPGWLEADIPTSANLAADLDTSLSNVFPDDPGERSTDAPAPPPNDGWQSTPSTRNAVSAEDYNLEAFVASSVTLGEHLATQLGLAIRDPAMHMVGQLLIAELDEAGYLRTDLNALAERIGASRALLDKTLAILKTFEPTGVFACNLAECLALQLAERNRLDPAMLALLANLDLVARRDFAQLRRLCGVDEADLSDMLGELRSLDPKPGAGFDPVPVQPLIPDVMVMPAADGGWRIELNSETLPRLLVNQTYYSTIAGHSRKDGDRSFLSECLQTANWLVKSLDQRAKTILKVATEIVRQQDGFLAHGVEHLRPLNLKAVAEAIGMHESTVSRVTSNKYMATSRGIFELKYFFTSAIASAEGGEAHSAEAVRHRIRGMIDAEADAVLSDDAIVKLLRRAGIDIARRTVAKYREAMQIPSSVHRRRDRVGRGGTPVPAAPIDLPGASP